MNQIVGMGLYDEVTAADLDRAGGFFPQPRRALFRGALAVGARVAAILLGERGYTIAEFNSVLIRRIKPEEPFSLPPGVVIERVTARRSDPWMAAIAKGFEQDIVVAESVFGGFASCRAPCPSWRASKTKWSEDAAGGVIPEARIAAFFGTATLPEYRGRGVQTALIAQRLHEAALAGCEYAVVSTNPGSGSQRNMERRGFRVAYTKPVMMRTWPLRIKRIWISKAFGVVASHFPTPLRTCSGDTTSASRSTASCSP